MASFTSSQSGDWNDPETWGNPPGGDYPFKNNNDDTAAISSGHEVEITADNPQAAASAGTVSVNGTLKLGDHACSQRFCGAITVNSGGALESADTAAAKKLQLIGGVTINSGGAFDWHRNSELLFDNDSQGQYGLYCEAGGNFYMQGASSQDMDCVVTGVASKEAYVLVDMGYYGAAGEGAVDNATVKYCYRHSSTYRGGITFSRLNNYYTGQFSLGNISVSDTASHGILFRDCTIEGGAVDSTVSSGNAIEFQDCRVAAGSFTGVSASGRGINIIGGIVHGGTLSGTSTSQIGIAAIGTALAGGTFTASSTQRMALYGSEAIFRDCTITAQSDAGSEAASCITGGAVMAGAEITAESTGHNAFDLAGGLLILGGHLKAEATGQYSSGFRFEGMPVAPTSGIIEATSGCSKGLNPYLGMLRLEHTGALHVINEASTAFHTSGIVVSQFDEPWIYVTDSEDKLFDIWFNCWPRNQSEFTASGDVRFMETAGQIDLVDAGAYVVFPPVQPFQVTEWGTVTADTAGTGITMEYRISNDGGDTWVGWTEFSSGADLSGETALGQGLDAIQFKFTRGSATAQVKNLLLGGNSYANIGGWARKDYLLPGFEPIAQAPGRDNYWHRY